MRVRSEQGEAGGAFSEATVAVRVQGHRELAVAEGVGPVDALSRALHKALCRFYPHLEAVRLADYKVRVLTPEDIKEIDENISNQEKMLLKTERLAFIEYDKQFHLYLASRIGNQQIESILDNLASDHWFASGQLNVALGISEGGSRAELLNRLALLPHEPSQADWPAPG